MTGSGRAPERGRSLSSSPKRGCLYRGPGGYSGRLLVALLSAALGLGLAGMVLNFTVRPIPEQTLSTASLEFDGERAFARAAEFVTTFPDRSPGSLSKVQASQWIIERLVELGYDPQVQNFGAWIDGVYYPEMANVWAVRGSPSTQAVVVYGHYDVPIGGGPGAAADGSAVGAMLELASVFADEASDRTVIFVFLDGSEYGRSGAEQFNSWTPYLGPQVAAIGLDFLNTGDMAGISVEMTGSRKGYTPLWLRELAGRAAERVLAGLEPATPGPAGPEPATTEPASPERAASEAAAPLPPRVYLPDTLSEWIERSVAISPTDTGVFLRQGIAAVNLAGVPTSPAFESSVYHTSDDVVHNLRPAAMEAWGRTAELITRTVINNGAPFADDNASSMLYLGLAGGRYLPGWAVRTIQFLLFAPLWGVVAVAWWRRRHCLMASLRIFAGLGRRVLALSGCLALGLLVIRLAVPLGLLPRYSFSPPPPNDPVYGTPNPVPVLVAVAVAALAVVVVTRFTRWTAQPLAADWPERHHALTTGLALVVLATLVFGSGFAPVTFLLPASYLWLLLGDPEGPASRAGKDVARVMGGLAAAAGGLTMVAFVALVGRYVECEPGWWYLVQGLAYGLFALKVLIAAALVGALHWEAIACGTGVGPGWVVPSPLPSSPLPPSPVGTVRPAGRAPARPE